MGNSPPQPWSSPLIIIITNTFGIKLILMEKSIMQVWMNLHIIRKARRRSIPKNIIEHVRTEPNMATLRMFLVKHITVQA